MPEVIKTILTADSSDLRAEFAKANNAVANFTSKTEQSLSRSKGSFKSLGSELSDFKGKALNSFGGISALAAGVAAGFATLAIATAASLKVLREYAAFDSLVRGLKVLDGTAVATSQRLADLREVAKLPGLGFEEAVRGDIRLRSAGISAELAERSLRAFGNALASAGAGKDELQGVFLALGQIAAKGKVSAEEINQIAERLPQIRAAMQGAFGTADTEAIQKLGISSKQFIAGIVTELEKLPKVTGGVQNDLDNFSDSFKQLKTQSAEFAVGMAGSWVRDVSRSFEQATRDLQKLKNALGIKTPGLQGPDGKTEEVRQAEIAAAEKLRIEQDTLKEQNRAHNENIGFWQKKEEERTEALRIQAAERVEIEKKAADRVLKAQEEIFAARLTPEANLTRQIDALTAEGPASAAAINEAQDPVVKAQIAERLARIIVLQKELNDLRADSAKQLKAEADAAGDRWEKARLQAIDTVKQHDAALADYDAELLALDLQSQGKNKLAAQWREEIKLRKEAAALAKESGLTEEEAMERVRLKSQLEGGGGRRRGITRRANGAGDNNSGNNMQDWQWKLGRGAGRLESRGSAGRHIENGLRGSILENRAKERSRLTPRQDDSGKILSEIRDSNQQMVGIFKKLGVY